MSPATAAASTPGDRPVPTGNSTVPFVWQWDADSEEDEDPPRIQLHASLIDETGETIPRKIINEFACHLDGEEVFRMKIYPAVSANPFISFWVTAEKSGELEFIWTDDDGSETRHKVPIEVKA